ncbi:MAG: hypothetical protein ACREIC_20210, partial [Limisphaerales bacterium]
GEAWLAMPLEVELRFGRWDQVLAEPAIPAQYPFSHAFRSAARAIAFAAKGDTAAASEEQAAYLNEAKAVPADDLAAGNNTCQAVFAVVTPMVAGEILMREGKTDSGIARLREAIQAEDELRYDEPPGWLIPVRHSLGATLMRLRRYAEAEQVYRDDLARLPNNGWSLFGLGEALGRQHKDAAAKVARSDFRRVWKKADIDIHSSCLCQPGA